MLKIVPPKSGIGTLIVGLIIGTLLLNINVCLCQEEHNEFIKQRNDDEVFTSNVIFTFDRRSKIACSVSCALNVDCIAFTFTKYENLTLGKCQGHDRFLDRGTTEISTGSRTYLLPGK